MGAASAICVFSHDRYHDCLAAPFRRLIQTGELDPWLAQLWRLKQSRYAPRIRRPFAFTPCPAGRNRMYLTGELTVSDVVTPTVLSWDDWLELEDLQHLFEFAFLRYCVGERQWMGNNTRPHWILERFLDVERGDPTPLPILSRLCEDLDQNGRVWTHCGGGFNEGVHGWLGLARTQDLLAELRRLSLPSPDLTYQQIVAEVGANEPAIYRQEQGVRLAEMRQVAQMAVDAGHGVLWSNDVYLLDNEPKPARLDPLWLTHADGAVVNLARSMRDESDFAALPVLADALEEAGCSQEEILLHCRGSGEHLSCCWVVDLCLGLT